MLSNFAWGVVKHHLRAIEGSTTDLECRWLYQAVRRKIPGVVVEIGSFLGKSTVALACGSMRVRGETVYAIDPHLGEAVINRKFSGPTYARFLTNIRLAGVTKIVQPLKQTSRQVGKGWNKPIRLLFIDGDHSYSGVTWDLKHFGTWVVNDGVIALHDALHPGDGPPRAIVEQLLTGSGYVNFGIVGSMLYCQKGVPHTVAQWINWYFFAGIMRLVAMLITLPGWVPPKIRRAVAQVVVKRWLKYWLNRL